ncbi:MAG: hypothetical protein E7638_08910 [Ruminococcaceae bacterium]|nr:hypothetical protein [Oscillospiraceae bacterium]
MSTENGKMFRSAISGYNKDDVNRYILESDKQFREEKEKLTKDIEDMGRFNVELAEKNDRLEEKSAEAVSRLAELEAEAARLKEEIGSLNETIRDLTKRHDFYKVQTEAQNETLTKAKAEKAALSEQIAALSEESRKKDAQIKGAAEKYAADLEVMRQAYEAELKQMKDAAKADDGVAYKLDMYDKISSQIGDILINANRNSDEIITTAKREAENILRQTNADAKGNAARMKENISHSSDRAIRELRGEFTGSMNNCVGEIQTCMTELRYEADSLLSLLEKKQAEIAERIDFYSAGLTEAVADRLKALDTEYSGIIGGESAAE